MCCSTRKTIFTLIILLLVMFGLTWWYRNLPPRKQQFIQNLLKQVPDLPVRYMV